MIARPFVLVCCLLFSACQRPAAPSITVAAAADLAFAFTEVGAAFEAREGTKVTFSFGSTGLLAKQIKEGAPFDVFAAANVSFIDDVIQSGNCLGDSKTFYARGRIVMWWRSDIKVSPPASLADLADGRFTKISIANPEHAPYGRAAQEALITAGVWGAVKPRLVNGENVKQALQFAETGNAEVAIVALSLASLTKDGASVLIDEAQHKLIEQALAICGEGEGAALGRKFTSFVNSEEGRVIMRRHGFLLPGETAN